MCVKRLGWLATVTIRIARSVPACLAGSRRPNEIHDGADWRSRAVVVWPGTRSMSCPFGYIGGVTVTSVPPVLLFPVVAVISANPGPTPSTSPDCDTVATAGLLDTQC